ncbi:Vgb family protein [Herbiconiux solani]|uniref:Vgb family protein n=1 Tax=Herbiconiux solani TaxID=661329 RepID=UPI000826F6A9|nr:hypothetical protein [Herbiconiux solani]
MNDSTITSPSQPRSRRSRLLLGLAATAAVAVACTAGAVTPANAILPSPSWHELTLATPGGFAHALTADPAGGVWYADNSNAQIVHVSYATGTTRVYPLPAGTYVSDEVQGADGSLWFSDPFAKVMRSLDPVSGTITSFPLATTGSFANSLMASADGVWFVDSSTNHIGRIAPDGTLLDTDTPAMYLQGTLASTSDGRVWSSAMVSPILDGFDPATGTFTSIDTGLDSVVGLAPASDGGLWAAGGTEIAHIDPTGAITRLPIPLPPRERASVHSLAEGAHGELYFADQNRGLGTVDASGSVSWTATPFTGIIPDDVTVTQTGLLWFVDLSNGSIRWRL